MMMKNKFWLQGFDAAAKGIGRDENPYRNLSKKFEIKKIWWQIGWEAEKAFNRLKSE